MILKKIKIPVFCFEFANHILHLGLLLCINAHHYLHRTFQLQQKCHNFQFHFQNRFKKVN